MSEKTLGEVGRQAFRDSMEDHADLVKAWQAAADAIAAPQLARVTELEREVAGLGVAAVKEQQRVHGMVCGCLVAAETVYRDSTRMLVADTIFMLKKIRDAI